MQRLLYIHIIYTFYLILRFCKRRLLYLQSYPSLLYLCSLTLQLTPAFNNYILHVLYAFDEKRKNIARPKSFKQGKILDNFTIFFYRRFSTAPKAKKNQAFKIFLKMMLYKKFQIGQQFSINLLYWKLFGLALFPFFIKSV